MYKSNVKKVKKKLKKMLTFENWFDILNEQLAKKL